MRAWWLSILLIVAAPAADGQPADCPPTGPPGGSLPLSIDLAGRPGVPTGVTGQAYIQVPINPEGTESCQTERPPPRDVLGGEPGNVLRGPPSPNLLRGPGTPHVEVEALPPR